MKDGIQMDYYFPKSRSMTFQKYDFGIIMDFFSINALINFILKIYQSFKPFKMGVWLVPDKIEPTYSYPTL